MMIPRMLFRPSLAGSAAALMLCAAAAATFSHSQPAHAQSSSSVHVDPQHIDSAIAAFVGASPGEAGGARHIVDRRLKLAVCSARLVTEWHGQRRDTVKVRCPGRGGWQIFVAVAPARGAEGVAAVAEPVVNRGDVVSIVVRGNGFSVAQAGEALEGGAPGDWIRVKPAQARDPLHAQVERPGLVIVPAI